MPKVPPGYAERKRQQILDGAVACFVRSGFSRTTIGDICKEAGISQAALYRYFPSKAAIVNAVVAASRREDTSRIREAAKSGTREALEELIRTFLLRVEERNLRALALELTAEASRDETLQDSLRHGRELILEPLTEVVRRAQARGELNPSLDPSGAARALLGVYWGFAVQHVLEPDTDVEGYVAATRAMVLGSFWCGPAWTNTTEREHITRVASG